MRPRIVIAAIGVVLCLAVLLLTRRHTDQSPGTAPATGPAEVPTVASSPGASPPSRMAPPPDGVIGFRPPGATVHDRALRDDLRRRILVAWSQQLTAPDAGAVVDGGDPLRLPMPTLDGGTVDPDYLRERIREDFLPMARACYEQFEARHPGVGGRSVADFVIVGDERVGAVVDEVRIESGDGGLSEPAFETCMRESMYTVAFRPPPGRGSLRVRYPFRFEAGAADAGLTPRPPLR